MHSPNRTTLSLLHRALQRARLSIAFDTLATAHALPVPVARPTYGYAIRVLRLWDATGRALYHARLNGALDQSGLEVGWRERRAFLRRHRPTLMRGLVLGSAA